jgi:Fuc2NAc and GlcNAc transferase
MLLHLGLTIVAAIAAFVAAGLIRANAQRLGVMQAPNARSSHTTPTPGGGGVGIVLGGSLVLVAASAGAIEPFLPGLVIGAMIAAVGFYDDRHPIPARLRLPGQLVLMAIAIWLAVPLDALQQQTGIPLPAIAVAVIALVGAVYWINLFNFMDGIDGIAGAQAIFMLVGAAILATLRVPGFIDGAMFWCLVGVTAATLGFLALNWPPARIFMGDAGSTYLGFILAFLALVTIADGTLSLPQWLILSAAFVTDASVTLIRRLLLRERVFEAHRRHAYQVLSRRFGAHQPVTLGFVALNAIWLLPLAWAATAWGWLAVLVAYGPLIVLAFYLGAGAPERPALNPR